MYIIIGQSEVASKTVSKYVFLFVSTERYATRNSPWSDLEVWLGNGITNSHVFTLDQSHLQNPLCLIYQPDLLDDCSRCFLQFQQRLFINKCTHKSSVSDAATAWQLIFNRSPLLLFKVRLESCQSGRTVVLTKDDEASEVRPISLSSCLSFHTGYVEAWLYRARLYSALCF